MALGAGADFAAALCIPKPPPQAASAKRLMAANPGRAARATRPLLKGIICLLQCVGGPQRPRCAIAPRNASITSAKRRQTGITWRGGHSRAPKARPFGPVALRRVDPVQTRTLIQTWEAGV